MVNKSRATAARRSCASWILDKAGSSSRRSGMVDRITNWLYSLGPKLHAQAESAIGVLYWMHGDYSNAKVHFEKADELASSCGDLRTNATVLSNLAMVRAQSHDLDGAESSFQQAYEVAKLLNDRNRQAQVLNNIGIVLNMKGEFERAIVKVQLGADIYSQLGDQLNVGLCLSNLASSFRRIGNLDAAMNWAREGIQVLLSLRDFGAVGHCLAEIGLVESARKNWTSAANIQGKVTFLMNNAGISVSPDTIDTWKHSCALTEESLGVKSYQHAFNEGIHKNVEAFVGKSES